MLTIVSFCRPRECMSAHSYWNLFCRRCALKSVISRECALKCCPKGWCDPALNALNWMFQEKMPLCPCFRRVTKNSFLGDKIMVTDSKLSFHETDWWFVGLSLFLCLAAKWDEHGCRTPDASSCKTKDDIFDTASNNVPVICANYVLSSIGTN